MLRRLRQAARRWPGLSLVLVLLAFTSQSLATTFDWCLHGGEGAHVANGLAPCEGQGESAAALEVTPTALVATADAPSTTVPPLPCHGGHAGGAMPAVHHVSAASDGAFTPASTVAAMPFIAHWQFLPWVLALESSGEPVPSPSRGAARREAGRPTLSDAVPGESFRLLI